MAGMLQTTTSNNRGCNRPPHLTATRILPKVLILLWAITHTTSPSMEEMRDILSAATNIGVQMCNARCFEIRSCRSFAFRDADLTCHLLSVVKTRHLEGFTVTPRVKILGHPCAKTSCKTGTRCVMDRQGNTTCIKGFASCGVPIHLLGAEVIYGDLFPGDKAHYTCGTHYRQCTPNTVSTCLPSGQWENMTGICGMFRWRSPAQMPFEASFPCGGQSRLFLSIRGRMTGDHSMTFIIRSGRDSVLYLSCRKNFPERENENNMLVTNTYINGTWGGEKKHNMFPFKVHRRFVLDLLLLDGIYEVRVNGKTYLSLMEKLPDAQPDSLRVVGDVRIETVVIRLK